MSLVDQLAGKFAVNAATGCWEWTASLTSGYGQIHSRGRTYRAHRVSYEAVKGPIPAGMQLDHLCRVRHCVNPNHLEPVTNRENTIRGDAPATNRERQSSLTRCKNGHALSGTNIHVDVHGYRVCRTCSRLKARRHIGGTTGRASVGPLREVVERHGRQALLTCGHQVVLKCGRRYRRARCTGCEQAQYWVVETVVVP